MRTRHLALTVVLTVASLAGLNAVAAGDTTPAPSPPANDNYLASTEIPGVATPLLQTYRDRQDITSATTQADLFNPDAQGQPFGGGGPEPTTCGTFSYGKTIWYDIHPKVDEQVQLIAGDLPTVMAVYQWNPANAQIIRRIGCQAQPQALNNTYSVGELLAHRRYTVQVGGLQTPTGTDGGPLDVTVNIAVDTDGDGIIDAQDACPRLPGIKQDAGCPPVIDPNISANWVTTATGLTITALTVSDIPGGSVVKAKCSCGIGQSVTAGRHASSVSVTAMAHHTLPRASTFQMWVTKRAGGHATYRFGAVGAYREYTVLAAKLSEPTRRCLLPGSLVPRRTCTR